MTKKDQAKKTKLLATKITLSIGQESIAHDRNLSVGQESVAHDRNINANSTRNPSSSIRQGANQDLSNHTKS